MAYQTESERIVEKYGTTVYRLCYVRLAGFDRSSVDDAYQNVFLSYMEHPPNVMSDSEAEKAWFIRCAINKCTDVMRSAYRHPQTSLSELENIIYDDSGEPSKNIVLNAIMILPDKYRMPIYLHYVYGSTLSETARALKLNEAALRMRLTRGRRELAKILEEW